MEFIQSYEEFDKYYMSNLNEFDDSINSELHHENYYIKSYQSLILPNIYNKIDNKEFMYIQIEKLDLSKNTNLTNIGKYAFATCNIKELKLPKDIETIGPFAFSNNQIEILDFSKYLNLKKIGAYAFSVNPLKEIKILGNITIDYIVAYKNDIWNEFVKYYNKNNKKTGDYKYINDDWQRYPLKKIKYEKK